MLLLLLLPLLTLVLWFTNTFWYDRRLKGYPRPTSLPILGSVLDLVDPRKQLQNLLKYRQKYNGDYYMYLSFFPMLFLSTPRSVEAVLTSQKATRKSKLYNYYLHRWLGNGLLVSHGDYWQKHRKIITPAFHFQILERYVKAFDGPCDVFVDILKAEQMEDIALNIYPYVSLCVLDIVCDATLGISINAQINSDSEYVKSVRGISKIVVGRMFSVLQQHDFFYRWTKNYREEKRLLKFLHNYSYSLINKRKEENQHIKTDEELSLKKKLAFLDLLLHYNQKENLLSDEEIREEVDTFLFEAHDTTSSAISFALYNLAKYPLIQEKVFKEIATIFDGNSRHCQNIADLNQMKYLGMVIKESMRLYPPVPLMARDLDEDIDLGDKIIPKGMDVGILTIGIHYDPQIFPNPYVFDPERFSPENTNSRHHMSYIPFSAGSRNCIGQKFGMLLVKAVISKLLRHYKVLLAAPGQNAEMLMELIMKPADGIMLKLQKR